MAFGQIMENFESGTLENWVQSTDGRWKADTYSKISGEYSLHHVFENPKDGIDCISIPVKNLHPLEGTTSWSFKIRHGYSPSSTNNWAVFLMSDKDPVNMISVRNINGYAIGVNISGSDDTLRLWKISAENIIGILSCGINWEKSIGTSEAARIDVDRSCYGEWSVSIYQTDGTLIKTVSTFDNELFHYPWFGIYYKYIDTKDRLLWFDDLKINGVFYADTIPPEITSYSVSGKNSVQITFSEKPADETVIPENFTFNNENKLCGSVRKTDDLTYELFFTERFLNKQENSLLVSGVCDSSRNCVNDIKLPFTPVWPEMGDVVISEIMADPLPVVSLPGKEYLEISNRTGFSFNTKNWKLLSDDQVALFPEVSLKPFGSIIVCASQDTSLFKDYGMVTGLKQFISLIDDGRTICLSDSMGDMLHGVEYSSSWYGDDLKASGGWSLEMIDTAFPFYLNGNWQATVSTTGGTPGNPNSVSRQNADRSFTGVTNIFPRNELTVFVEFSEPVFCVDGNNGAVLVEANPVDEIKAEDPLFRRFSVRFKDPLIKSKVYRFSISDKLTDFAGNTIEQTDYYSGLAERASPGDILFNELLFNPLPGDPDYMEFYNNSEKILDAARLQIISIADDTGDTSQIIKLSEEEQVILPQYYYAVTNNPEKICSRYLSADPACLFGNASLPSMSDGEGHLVLFNRELEKIDEVKYNEKMHYSLLSDYEGIALEKISASGNSMDATNWHSASESAGWGTPGSRNSVFQELIPVKDEVTLSSTKISPDNNGFEDNLVIQLRLTGTGNVISVSVFDELGNYVKEIAENFLAGPETDLVWDGTADDGSPVSTGIYIVYITLFDDKGKTEKWKKVCTVIW